MELSMTGFSDVKEGLGNRLSALAGVTSRKEFGNEAFFVGEAKFAAVTDRALVLHLPPKELTEAFKTGQARPFVSAGTLSRHGWIELPLASFSPRFAEPWIDVAYRSAQHTHRRTRIRKPAAARRVRTRQS
jgi:hypothetical protein